MATPKEKRKNPRFELNLRARSGFTKLNQLPLGTNIKNVSEGGVFITTSAPLKVRDVVSITVLLPDETEERVIVGRVRWHKRDEPQGYGVEFNMDEMLQDAIKKIVHCAARKVK